MGPFGGDAGPAGRGCRSFRRGLGCCRGRGSFILPSASPAAPAGAAIIKIALLALAFLLLAAGGAVCGVFYGPVYPGSLFPRVGGTGRGCCGRPPVRCGRRKGSAGSCLRWRSPLFPVRSCSFLSRRLCLCFRMNGPLSAFFPVSWPTACRGKRRPGTPGMQDKGINLQNI